MDYSRRFGTFLIVCLRKSTCLFKVSTEKLLEEAYKQAREKAGIVWNGQEFLVQGNPAVLDNASAEE